MGPQTPGIRNHLSQFLWLVLSTVLVGMTIGLERAVVPLLGKDVYHIASVSLIFAFIVVFGVTKAILNLLAGHFSDAVGRRPILIIGWLCGVPMILLLLLVHTWSAVIVANVFLGANQAFAWTMTITQQLDLVNAGERGLAMGINEATGYIGVSISTILTGLIAAKYGLLETPFLYGAAVLLFGLGTSILVIRETRGPVRLETAMPAVPSAQPGACGQPVPSAQRARIGRIVWSTTIGNPTLSALSQAGLVNKLADTLVWAMVPLYLASMHVSIREIGYISGVYTMVWGVGQFGTGVLSDVIGRKPPIFGGMVLLGLGVLALGFARGAGEWLVSAAGMGLGMALLYPNLNAAVADVAPPDMRGGVLGVYRMWRDGGYAVGGLLLGWTSHLLGMRDSLFLVGVIVLLSAGVILLRMKETHPRRCWEKGGRYG